MYPHLFTLDCEIKTSISLESFAQVVYLHYMFCVDSICVLVLKGYVHQYRTHTRKCGVFWWWTLQDQPKDLLETLQVVTLYPKTSHIDSKPVDCKPCKRIGAGLVQPEHCKVNAITAVVCRDLHLWTSIAFHSCVCTCSARFYSFLLRIVFCS